ncbi:hypothetical protein [Paenibacillus cremeus]|uniref:Uncharacterized protein n=1 Tax=Paenibacillus cremeus TaxID=2163881 RepID=A0A559JPT2_9BACL|nr:hypothetical protein [Paenibacillus cremeus]TVY01881.1 hypothetical protein FPZ49_32050 [Paenibacillus cremeus]
MKIGIVGDYHADYPSQRATNEALLHSIEKSEREIKFDWIPTSTITEQLDSIVKSYNGFWIAPGRPESAIGVLQIIKYAREANIP